MQDKVQPQNKQANMEETIELKGWVARDGDRDAELSLYIKNKPNKHMEGWWANGIVPLGLPDDSFPSVKWSDPEPREATITITLK